MLSTVQNNVLVVSTEDLYHHNNKIYEECCPFYLPECSDNYVVFVNIYMYIFFNYIPLYCILMFNSSIDKLISFVHALCKAIDFNVCCFNVFLRIRRAFCEILLVFELSYFENINGASTLE